MKDIILIGPKHSGKTSAGKALASLYSYFFIDIDKLVFNKTKENPRQLFIKGKPVFQRAETKALVSLANSGRNSYKDRNRRHGLVKVGTNKDRTRRYVPVENNTLVKQREITANRFKRKIRVIATGGGIIDNKEALSVLKKPGVKIVYLDIPAETAWGRIAAKGELPPFLKTENPKETHRVLHERRAAAYLQIAEIIIKAEGKSPKEVAAEIHSRL
jgi:shikimate kinase